MAVALFLAALVYTLIVFLLEARPANALDDSLPGAFAAVGLLALLGWWWDRSRRAASEEDIQRERLELEARLQDREGALRETKEELETARRQEAEERSGREKLSSKLENREQELGRERYLRSRVEEARRMEKEWNRELQTEVMRTYKERGTLGDPSDIPSLVLRLAKALLEVEKGLLLSRQDDDGELELLAHEGFDNDPEDSTLVHRFANEVLERDVTSREDEPRIGEHEEASPADEEIENLVAIPIYIQDEFNGVVVCANRPNGFEEYDDEVLLSLGDHVGAVLENARLQGELRTSYLATVTLLAQAMEAKDPFLRSHSEDVAGYVEAVADRLDFGSRAREELIFASVLHDVGKIGISERILLKPAQLTPEEFNVIKLHPRIGYRLVEQVPALQPIAQSILHHHEYFDGGGYPSGLRGEEIPLEARIICVADAFSAMTSGRPYHKRMSIEEACSEVERNAGTQFDPKIARIFVEEVRRNPPAGGQPIPSDPEIELRRDAGEPVLGYGPLSVTDNLTLLYTHRYFHEVAEAEAQRATVQNSTFTVALVELAGISAVNQSEGYAAGDKEIKRAARALQRWAVRHGATACRHGGRRLGVIVPGDDEASAGQIPAEVAEDLAGGAEISIGTAVWSAGESGDDVVARAYNRLKEAPESQ
ncbi:MAG: HD domain-containing phosphohydrolase [Rubrobacteraceae bacterium]